jgi:type III restriction enzyme
MPKTWVQYDRTLPFVEDREPNQKPNCHLVKDGANSYKVVEGRRPSKMLLVPQLREKVDKWREGGYEGATDTTKELLRYWFEEDHIINGELLRYWFCQREAVETLAYLFEVKKFDDLAPVIDTYSEKYRKDLLGKATETVEDVRGNRKLVRYFPELEQMGEQDLPPKGLLRYAFKMATGSGKTYAMALIMAWSYFNRTREKNSRYADNFLVVAPNVIVYERLSKDFADNRIFFSGEIPIIPPAWRGLWSLKVTVRGDDSPLNRSGNIILNNIQQIYESKQDEWSPTNIVDAILGRKPQKDLTKPPITLLEKIKLLDNLCVINDEAHHIHDERLEWHKTLISIHGSLPKGLTLWLDFSATPKTQMGTYFPWIVVDYPLAQAIEDRIVKSPLIVHRIDKKDPDNINRDNVVQKYSDWITAALERWKEHYGVYSSVGKKPVLFIMAEKNQYADRIAEAIRRQKDKLRLKNDDEVLIIHTDTSGEILKSDLEDLRRAAMEIDSKESNVKIVVSVLMLREGWDVKNVTIVLGLRPFTSKAEILPEQAVGRGLRLMQGISPDHTQTLEVMGTSAFETFVKELEKEGVGVNTVTKPPPLPVKIGPERSRLEYDIEMPATEFRFKRNYRKVTELDPLKLPSLYSSSKLDEDRRITLRMEFPVTETRVHQASIEASVAAQGRELVSHITQETMKRARFTSDFGEIYPVVESYILQRCFETRIPDIEDVRLKKHLGDFNIQETIIDLLAKEMGKMTAEPIDTLLKQSSIQLSSTEPFTWRRKHSRCRKTVFNFVAAYNDFELEFANFLDNCSDIKRFAALAGLFRIDYLSSRGAIRLYLPDFVAVQKDKKKEIFWIIETKGREYEDTDRKDAAMQKWCEDISESVKERWAYLKVRQYQFDAVKRKTRTFSELLRKIEATS